VNRIADISVDISNCNFICMCF